MAICSLLQNRPSCPTLKSAIMSHFRNRRFCPIFEIGGSVSFKISCFVLPPILLIGQFADLVFSMHRLVCYLIVHGINYLRKTWQRNPFFFQKTWKVWWLCQESWSLCRHHGMIVTIFRHDHGKIMARQPCFSDSGPQLSGTD